MKSLTTVYNIYSTFFSQGIII